MRRSGGSWWHSGGFPPASKRWSDGGGMVEKKLACPKCLSSGRALGVSTGQATINTSCPHQTPRRARDDIIALTMFSDCDVSLKLVTINPLAENKACPVTFYLFLCLLLFLETTCYNTLFWKLDAWCHKGHWRVSPTVGWDYVFFYSTSWGNVQLNKKTANTGLNISFSKDILKVIRYQSQVWTRTSDVIV